ncbi:MAG: T9SS type A sorting domain-containing protein [Bacteroidales bacterium]|nr:T9SS type A sorting domain-containing protein [Bacteroidales bacterium]
MMRIKNFTFFTAIIAIFALTTPLNTYSQVYQFENPGFEDWPGSATSEPTGWNSYPSANCTLTLGCSAAKNVRHERSTDTRPGSTGQYSCRIYATSTNLIITTVVANGALTSGQMQLVSASASNAGNGNRTITNNDDYNHHLNAKPDSIVFWAKVHNASNTSEACCHLYIHDNYNLQDPLGGNQAGYEAHIVGKVPSYNFTNTSGGVAVDNSGWRRHSSPIYYEGCQSNDPQFVLVTFSTNYQAMAGSGGDELFIDDIEFIYNANLSSIKVNGTNIPNFNQNTTEYWVDVECGATNYISATTASPRASYSTSLSADGQTAYINVTHGDKSKTYTIHYHGVKTNPISDHICKGDSYSQNGFTLPTQDIAGVFSYSNTYPLAGGCDSVVELSLNVHNTYNTNVDLTICSSATYNFHGQIVDQPGTYYATLTSQYGCDSLITLNLDVNSYYQVNLNEHICEGEASTTPGFEGRLDAGIDTLQLVATNSCDSIVILRLEVGRIDNVALVDSVEVDTDYSNYGFDLAAIHDDGEYTFTNTLVNNEGCDSIVTLTLKVLPKPVIPEPEVVEVPDEITFDVFPSPASGQVTVRANYDIGKTISTYEYMIYDELGNLTDKGLINSQDTILDISKYNSGYYYIKILYGNSAKEIKKRKAIKFVVAN